MNFSFVRHYPQLINQLCGDNSIDCHTVYDYCCEEITKRLGVIDKDMAFYSALGWTTAEENIKPSFKQRSEGRGFFCNLYARSGVYSMPLPMPNKKMAFMYTLERYMRETETYS